jgi:hypothetical protein
VGDLHDARVEDLLFPKQKPNPNPERPNHGLGADSRVGRRATAATSSSGAAVHHGWQRSAALCTDGGEIVVAATTLSRGIAAAARCRKATTRSQLAAQHCRDVASRRLVVTNWQHTARPRSLESTVTRGTRTAATSLVDGFDPFRHGYDPLLLLLVIGYAIWKHLAPPPNRRLRLWSGVGGGIALFASCTALSPFDAADLVVIQGAMLVALAMYGEIVSTTGPRPPPIPRAVARPSGTRAASALVPQPRDARELPDRTRTRPRCDARDRC